MFEHGPDVRPRFEVYAGHANVSRLHPRQVVYQDLHRVSLASQMDGFQVVPRGVQVFEHKTTVAEFGGGFAA